MGRQFVSNTIKSTIDTTSNIVVNQAQTCTTLIQQSAQFNCTAGGDIDIQGTITLRNDGRLNTSCIQKAVTDVGFQESIQNQIDQEVKAIAQAFNISGGQDIQQLTDAVNKISLAISSSISQDCANRASQVAVFSCGAGGNVTIGDKAVINIENYATAAASCVADQRTVINASVDLQQIIQQKADAEIQSLITQLAWLCIAAAILVALILFGPELAGGSGGGGSKITTILLILVGIIIVYLVAAYFLGWWPFAA
jgi:hypothetical protein